LIEQHYTKNECKEIKSSLVNTKRDLNFPVQSSINPPIYYRNNGGKNQRFNFLKIVILKIFKKANKKKTKLFAIISEKISHDGDDVS
jgi:hypothetical protein